MNRMAGRAVFRNPANDRASCSALGVHGNTRAGLLEKRATVLPVEAHATTAVSTPPPRLWETITSSKASLLKLSLPDHPPAGSAPGRDGECLQQCRNARPLRRDGG